VGGAARHVKPLHGLIKRHEVQVLRRAGHSQTEVCRLTGVSVSEIRRIDAEAPIEHFDDAAERKRRNLGRPSKAEPLRAYVVDRLGRSPKVSSLELFYDAKGAGYEGSKSAFYALVAKLRTEVTRTIDGIGNLPGDMSLHGVGEVDVRFATGERQRVHFLVSQLTYSRWSELSVIPDAKVESLLRGLLDHFEIIGGVPLLLALDRDNVGRIVSGGDGSGGTWDPSFAQAILGLGVGIELRGPRERSGADALVRWVKTSFFRGRRFVDLDEMRQAMRVWCDGVNEASGAGRAGPAPASRMSAERVRLRPVAVRADDFALSIPVLVGPEAEIVHEGVSYSMPAETIGKRGMLHLHPTRARVVGDGFDVEHERSRRS
jgi:hypothetical protein